MDEKAVIDFWFHEIDSKQHWVKDPDFDRLITDRFHDVHKRASQGELWAWRGSAVGRLAEIIVLDQFSRNMYRDHPKAFAFDPMALVLAQETIRLGLDQESPIGQRHFLYMPFMHSESRAIHEQAIQLFSQEGLSPDFELKHKKIIDRFGRYPHRNEILGRESTDEEVRFLKEPNSSF